MAVDGFSKAYGILRQTVRRHLRAELLRQGQQALQHAVRSYKSPQGPLTGNTITSYCAGIYIDGTLYEIYRHGDGMKAPVRVKLTKGETAPAGFIDWAGNARKRAFTGSVDTDGGYGSDTAVKFLRSYRPGTSDGVSVVICSGTEYSEYIEQRMNGNVMTGTWGAAKSIFSNFKPIAG